MSREAFLARVAEAARRGRAYPAGVDDPGERAGYAGVGEGDLCRVLAAEVQAVGGKAEVVGDDAAARQALDEWLHEHPAARAVCWRRPLLDRLGLAELLAGRDIERLDYESLHALDEPRRRQEILAAEIGITSVDWAIAETGTLLLRAGPGRERVASLLPPAHLAIVERSQIVPDLYDAFDRMGSADGGDLPSNMVLITGPSKTGDIELQLTTGVHGPGDCTVLIVDCP